MKTMTLKNLVFIFFAVFITGCNMQGPKGVITDVTSSSAELTLMVYMAADNDLETYALKNLKAMERAEFEGINILVLLDRCDGYDETDGNWSDTRLFKVTHSSGNESSIISKRLDCAPLGLSSSSETELDTADWTVLKTFIEFSKESYPAKNYALIMWGHGGGLGSFAIDVRSDRTMSITELAKAIKGQGLCVTGFDTCFGGVLEAVYELKDCTPYIAASPGMTPSEGLDYKKLLEETGTENFSPFEFAKAMSRSCSVSSYIYKTSSVNSLFESFEAFAGELSLTVTDSESRQELFETLYNSKSYSADTYPCDMFLEVRALASSYSSSALPDLKEAAENLIHSVDDTVSSPDGKAAEISVYFIPKEKANLLSDTHPSHYVKNLAPSAQCAFVTDSVNWVPTSGGNSSSVLDKLFYTVF